MAGKQNPRSFGAIKKKGGRYYPSYMGPDKARHTPGQSFGRKADAETWLEEERKRVTTPEWCPPKQWAALEQARIESAALAAAEHPFKDVAARYMRHRTQGPKALKPRTAEHYEKLLDQFLNPHFGTTPVKALDTFAVEDWYWAFGDDRPTYRAHAYSLLSTIMKYAVSRGLVAVNPCQIVGASNVKTTHEIKPATQAELNTLVAALPARYRVMALLAAWCGLRFGELAELRRHDVDLANDCIWVRRGVTLVKGEHVVGTPKSEAGVRMVPLPPHLVPLVKDHLAANMNGRDGLLFPAADGTSTLRPSTLYRVFYPAREKAGRPDLRWHDLRHTAATAYTEEGATPAEVMALLGHSTFNAAMRYQHANQDRLVTLASRMSDRAAR